MTNGWIDIKNTDMMLIMGGNPAENHPCGFKWAIEAKLHRNAKTIVVDPRLTRTAATADLYLQIRAGADIAFLGGLIHYAVENNRIAHDYLVNYTNAAFIIKDGFKLPDDGLFSGFDAEKKSTTRQPGITRKAEIYPGSRRLRRVILSQRKRHRARRRLHPCCPRKSPTTCLCSIRAVCSNC
jgi:anaerobic selenocysteine-containing dehydrogenase